MKHQSVQVKTSSISLSMRHKRLLTVVVFAFTCLMASAQIPDFNWVSNGNQKNIIRHAIKYDSKGNLYLLGMYSETVNVDPGGTDLTLEYVSSERVNICLLKYNTKGTLIKGVRIGGAYAKEILIDKSGNIIISASYRGSMDFDGDGTDELNASEASAFIAKYDSDLNFVWAANMPELHSMTLDADGNIYSIMEANGTFTYGKKNHLKTVTYYDYFVFVTLKPDGTLKSEFSLWSNYKQINIQNNHIMVDSDKNIYCSGYFTLSADFDPGAGTAVLKEIGRDYGTGLVDAFVVKFDSAGNFKWVKQIGDKYNEKISTLGINHSNELLFIGYSDGNIDVDPGPGVFNTNNKEFMMKMDQNGDFVWFQPIADNLFYNVQNRLVSFDRDDNAYLGGGFQGTVDFDVSASVDEHTSLGYWDLFIQKLSKNGKLVWVKTFGGVYNDKFIDLDVLDSNTMAFTANFTNEVWLKSGTQLQKYTSACDSCSNGFLIRTSDSKNSGLSEIESQNSVFRVYPNPSGGKAWIESGEEGQLLIYNSLGMLVKTIDIEKDTPCETDLAFAGSGLYTLVLFTEKGRSTQKLMITH